MCQYDTDISNNYKGRAELGEAGHVHPNGGADLGAGLDQAGPVIARENTELGAEQFPRLDHNGEKAPVERRIQWINGYDSYMEEESCEQENRKYPLMDWINMSRVARQNLGWSRRI